MPEADFIGLDLTSSQRKPSACVGLDKELGLIFMGFLSSNVDIIAMVESHSPGFIAIDAPLTLPQGLCCLEESCSCKSEKGRECERELARLGIPCYFTTKHSIIREMVYRGIRIRNKLESRGYKVIEIYPYATKIRLWGKPIPSKLKPAGLNFLQLHLTELMPCLSPYINDFNHDLCDAAVAAYTAYLHYLNRTEQVGNPKEGVIFIPEGILCLTPRSFEDKIAKG